MRIVETNRGRWQIENAKGDVIVYDLMIGSKVSAERYIKNYVSSFMNYNYEVVPLKQEKSK